MRSYRRTLCLLALAALAMLSCSVAALPPTANDTPTPCPANCPPPQLGGGTPHTVSTSHFTLTYYDPWSVDSSNSSSNSVALAAGTQLGDVEVVVAGQRVAAGITAQQLLSRTAQSQLDPNQFSGLQDAGPIRGAEIGYVSGAGETFEGYATQANAPDTPVFIQMMASVRGTTGLTFTTISPIDPNSSDPSAGVPNEEYDRICNSIVWK